jgi:hypothetical protein
VREGSNYNENRVFGRYEREVKEIHTVLSLFAPPHNRGRWGGGLFLMC